MGKTSKLDTAERLRRKRERGRNYYREHKEERRAYRLKRLADPDVWMRDAEKKSQYGKKHRKRLTERLKARLAADPELKARYEQMNRRCTKNWQANHADAVWARNRMRDARKYGVRCDPRDSISSLLRFIKASPRIVCSYCCREVPAKDRSIDHWIPLCDRGAHTFANLVICCRRCNNQKHRKSAVEFIAIVNQPTFRVKTPVAKTLTSVMRTSLAREIITRREARGWTQSQLAKRADIHIVKMNNVERALSFLDGHQLRKIDNALRRQ